MAEFDFVSCDGCGASGIVCFKKDGELMAPSRSIFKDSCGKINDKWGIDDIYWVFLPGKIYDTAEKESFLEMLNPHYTEIRAICKGCVGYAEINQVPLEGPPTVDFSPKPTDRLTADDIKSLVRGNALSYAVDDVPE